MKGQIKGPVMVKSGRIHIVCFLDENGDLLQFNPEPRFKTPVNYLDHFLVGEIVEVPEGQRIVESSEIIPPVNIKFLEPSLRDAVREAGYVVMNQIVAGYRYKLGIPSKTLQW